MMKTINECLKAIRQRFFRPKQKSLLEACFGKDGHIDFDSDAWNEYITYEVRYGCCTLVKG